MEGVRLYLAGVAPNAPLPFAEYRVARWMHWADIDMVPTHRVREAIAFMNADIEHDNAIGGDAGTGGAPRMSGGAIRPDAATFPPSRPPETPEPS